MRRASAYSHGGSRKPGTTPWLKPVLGGEHRRDHRGMLLDNGCSRLHTLFMETITAYQAAFNAEYSRMVRLGHHHEFAHVAAARVAVRLLMVR